MVVWGLGPVLPPQPHITTLLCYHHQFSQVLVKSYIHNIYVSSTPGLSTGYLPHPSPGLGPEPLTPVWSFDRKSGSITAFHFVYKSFHGFNGL